MRSIFFFSCAYLKWIWHVDFTWANEKLNKNKANNKKVAIYG